MSDTVNSDTHGGIGGSASPTTTGDEGTNQGNPWNGPPNDGVAARDDDDDVPTTTTTTAGTGTGTATGATKTTEETTPLKFITEGSATMTIPPHQESTVFYNPVQVQNRDLSVLMIALHAERRAIRRAVKRRKKELMSEKPQEKEKRQQQKQRTENSVLLPEEGGEAGNNNSLNTGATTTEEETIESQLQRYESSLDVPTMLREGGTEDGITILDALAASGLRSIRYWKEIPGVRHVTINDLDEAAVDRARENVRRNGLAHVLLGDDNSDRSYGICVHHGDATHELYQSRRPQQLRNFGKVQGRQHPMWDVIDLDPYGSAAPFLDGAVQAVESGGLLCVTCTDMAALGGSHPETAYGRYAGLPIQSAKYLQELALRILLHTIAISAARYGRTIKPILSVGMAFYVRVFVEIHNDKRGVNDLSLHIGNVYQSTKCSSFVTIPHGQMGGHRGNVYQSSRLTPSVCSETGAPFKVGGPLWLGPLHDQSVIRVALERLSDPNCPSPGMGWIATRTRLQGLLTSVSEELEVPLYYTLPDLCRVLHCSSPPLREFKAALVNAGYSVSGYHKEPNAVKTDAPSSVVWDIMRAWVEKNPPPPKAGPADDSPAAKILSAKSSIEVDFSVRKSDSATGTTSTIKISRFPLNPERNWGPMRKASGKRKADEALVGKEASTDAE
jgi:tRNA (guanine26-N2/guanine27-N2)-dimethyltransferase